MEQERFRQEQAMMLDVPRVPVLPPPLALVSPPVVAALPAPPVVAALPAPPAVAAQPVAGLIRERGETPRPAATVRPAAASVRPPSSIAYYETIPTSPPAFASRATTPMPGAFVRPMPTRHLSPIPESPAQIKVEEQPMVNRDEEDIIDLTNE
jgi:hypothetical protein